jgi:hypothetical protein
MQSTNLALLVTQPSPIQLLLDDVRRLRAGTNKPQRDEEVRSIAKKLLTTQQYKGAEHLLALAYDALERGGKLEDAEAFGHTWIALMRDRHEQLHPTLDHEVTSLADVHVREQVAQGEREIAEIRFALQPTEANLHAVLDAIAVHQHATDAYVAFLRYLAVGGQARIDRRCGGAALCA